MEVKIAENIKIFRKESGLTQEQLAEALGVTVGAVYKWEAGLSIPEVRMIMEIADLFEVSVDVLLGYEQQRGNVDELLSRIQSFRQEKNVKEALAEANKALKKYPNHFDIVYQSALTYQVEFIERGENHALERAIELFEHSISLVNQNVNRGVSEISINNNIAECYIMSGNAGRALELLKNNNICGINDGLIGVTYASVFEDSKEAMPYLIRSYSDCLKNILRTMSGMSIAYEQAERYQDSIEVMKWLYHFAGILKIDPKSVTYVDKLMAVFRARTAVLLAKTGECRCVSRYLKQAYRLAEGFDKNPVHNLQGVRFCKGLEEESEIHDDAGKNAMAAVENIIYEQGEENEAYEYVRTIWENLKNEENNRK